MKNELAIFKNEAFGEIRTIEEGNQIWFAANDICKIFEIQNTSQAISRLGKEDVQISNIYMVAKTQFVDMIFITETGLYELAFTSRKENARMFTKWVANEVLPSIRKTGMYGFKPKTLGATMERRSRSFKLSVNDSDNLALSRKFWGKSFDQIVLEALYTHKIEEHEEYPRDIKLKEHNVSMNDSSFLELTELFGKNALEKVFKSYIYSKDNIIDFSKYIRTAQGCLHVSSKQNQLR
jgi:prophage antirepressor-like protein